MYVHAEHLIPGVARDCMNRLGIWTQHRFHAVIEVLNGDSSISLGTGLALLNQYVCLSGWGPTSTWYCSWRPDPAALTVDAFSVLWKDHYPYMFLHLSSSRAACTNSERTAVLIAPCSMARFGFLSFSRVWLDGPSNPDMVTNIVRT